VLNVVLKTVLERLEGSGVKVFLHGYNLDDVKKWNRALEASGYEQVQFNPEVPEFNPIAQAQKRT
jgi:hypothetical protein